MIDLENKMDGLLDEIREMIRENATPTCVTCSCLWRVRISP